MKMLRVDTEGLPTPKNRLPNKGHPWSSTVRGAQRDDLIIGTLITISGSAHDDFDFQEAHPDRMFIHSFGLFGSYLYADDHH